MDEQKHENNTTLLGALGFDSPHKINEKARCCYNSATLTEMLLLLLYKYLQIVQQNDISMRCFFYPFSFQQDNNR